MLDQDFDLEFGVASLIFMLEVFFFRIFFRDNMINHDFVYSS
jgi:hypothetical protein